MITKKDILDAVKNLKRHAEGHKEKRLIHPRREWLIGLCLTLVILVVSGLYAFNLYQTYTTIDTIEGSPAETVPSYRGEIVMSVLETNIQRNERFDQLQNLYTSVTQVATSTPIGTSTEAIVVLDDDGEVVESSATSTE